MQLGCKRRGGRKSMGMRSSWEARPRAVSPVGFRLWPFDILQSVKRRPRASRISGQKDCRWKMRDSRAPDPGLTVGGKRFLLDICTREGIPLRRMCRGVSAAVPSGCLFAFPQEGLSPLQIEKHAGKSAPISRLLDVFFPERGMKSGEMRTTALRLAEKKSVYCGKRCALLRRTNGDFTAFLAKICE